MKHYQDYRPKPAMVSECTENRSIRDYFSTVADFIAYTAMQLEGVPLFLDIAVQICGDTLCYTKKGTVVATFKVDRVP